MHKLFTCKILNGSYLIRTSVADNWLFFFFVTIFECCIYKSFSVHKNFQYLGLPHAGGKWLYNGRIAYLYMYFLQVINMF